MILLNIKNISKYTHIDFTDFRPEDQGLWGTLSTF